MMHLVKTSIDGLTETFTTNLQTSKKFLNTDINFLINNESKEHK